MHELKEGDVVIFAGQRYVVKIGNDSKPILFPCGGPGQQACPPSQG